MYGEQILGLVEAVLWIRIRMDPYHLAGSGSVSNYTDPDPDRPKRIRPNETDPYGSGSTTLFFSDLFMFPTLSVLHL